jgi:hypothetical protein
MEGLLDMMLDAVFTNTSNEMLTLTSAKWMWFENSSQFLLNQVTDTLAHIPVVSASKPIGRDEQVQARV